MGAKESTLATFALFVLLVAMPAWPQDHDANHDWYKDLAAPSGGSCCNGRDCRVATARMTPWGTWEAYVNGVWVDVPSAAILSDHLNKSPLNAHICESGGWIRCFLRRGAGT